jgi:hypothetical protein
VRAYGTFAHIFRPRNEPLNIVVRQEMKISKIPRVAYSLTICLALPGCLYIAFETFGLALIRSESLALALTPRKFPITVLVGISIPMTMLWLAQSLGSLTYPGYKKMLAVPERTIFTFIFAICFHFFGAVWLSGWTLSALGFIIGPIELISWGAVIREVWCQFLARSPTSIQANESHLEADEKSI